MSSTDEAAAFELTAPGSGEDTRAPKPPPAPGERGRCYKQGCSREQLMLLPPSVNQYVAEDNPVRAIAAYVDQLDLAALGFANTAGPLSAGQPAYDPADHLKLYLYGYLNRVRSTRRLALECERNLEVIWLLAVPCRACAPAVSLGCGPATGAAPRKNEAPGSSAVGGLQSACPGMPT